MNLEPTDLHIVLSPLEGFTNRAEVVAVGRTDTGVKVGDVVMYQDKHPLTEPFVMDGKNCVMYHDYVVLAILRPTN